LGCRCRPSSKPHGESISGMWAAHTRGHEDDASHRPPARGPRYNGSHRTAGRMGVAGVGDHLLPTAATSGCTVGTGLRRFFLAGGLVQPGIAFGGDHARTDAGRCVTHATSILVRSSACTNASGDVPGTFAPGDTRRVNALQSIRISRSETRPAGRFARRFLQAHQWAISSLEENGLEIAKLGPTGFHGDVATPEQAIHPSAFDARLEHAAIHAAPRQIDVDVGETSATACNECRQYRRRRRYAPG